MGPKKNGANELELHYGVVHTIAVNFQLNERFDALIGVMYGVGRRVRQFA